MDTLYTWLMKEKGYSEFEAEMALYYYDGFSVPDEVKKDIKEYTELYIQWRS